MQVTVYEQFIKAENNITQKNLDSVCVTSHSFPFEYVTF